MYGAINDHEPEIPHLWWQPSLIQHQHNLNK